MTADRYTLAGVVANLERDVAQLTRTVERCDETLERVLRENRSLRARVDQLDELDRWTKAARP
jgi:regulator of replication initiation timing